MKIVEISASLGNDLKRYNTMTKVSMEKQPFATQVTVLYGVTKPTDIVQTNAPTNILIDVDDNPIDDSQDVYFGIRVYPFISMVQDISCDNNNISYGEVVGLSYENYFPNTSFSDYRVLPAIPYRGQLYPEPIFEDFSSASQMVRTNYKQAMQQFVNDCTFPTKPNLDIPGQSSSDYYYEDAAGIPYFARSTYILSELPQRQPTGVLNRIQDKENPDTSIEERKYMVQFDGQNLNFKFGMAVNSDFAETPNIYLPYLYRTNVALVHAKNWNIDFGVIMQCLLYDSNGKVISA